MSKARQYISRYATKFSTIMRIGARREIAREPFFRKKDRKKAPRGAYFCVRYYEIKRNGAYQINVSAKKFTFHVTDRRQVSYIPSKLVFFILFFLLPHRFRKQPDVALFHPVFQIDKKKKYVFFISNRD